MLYRKSVSFFNWTPCEDRSRCSITVGTHDTQQNTGPVQGGEWKEIDEAKQRYFVMA